jgi:NADH-quinone oxidoreductase subunit L
MTIPLSILAGFAVLAGFMGTPALPWFHAYLNGGETHFAPAALVDSAQVKLLTLSTIVVGAAFFLGWRIYRNAAMTANREKDPLEISLPQLFRILANKFYIDELYEATVIRANRLFAVLADWLDRAIWSGIVRALSALTVAFAKTNRAIDESAVNAGFDSGCEGLRHSGDFLAWAQNGRIQRYLRIVGLAFSILVLLLIWGCA